MSSSNVNPTKRKVNTIDQNQFVKYQQKERFEIQDKAERNFNYQRQIPSKVDNFQQLNDIDYFEYQNVVSLNNTQKMIDEQVERLEGKKIDQQNVFKPTQHKISLQMQEKILKSQVLEQEQNLQKLQQHQEIQTEQQDGLKSSFYSQTSPIQQLNKSEEQSSKKRTLGTKDYSSISSQSITNVPQAPVKQNDKDKKNVLIKHLKKINIPTISSTVKQQSATENTNEYFSQTRVKDIQQQEKYEQLFEKKYNLDERNRKTVNEMDFDLTSSNLNFNKIVDQLKNKQKNQMFEKQSIYSHDVANNYQFNQFNEKNTQYQQPQQQQQYQQYQNQQNIASSYQYPKQPSQQYNYDPNSNQQVGNLPIIEPSFGQNVPSFNQRDMTAGGFPDLNQDEILRKQKIEDEKKKIANQIATIADRSRKRTEKNRKKKKQQQENNKNVIEGRHDMEQLPEQQRMRSMKDIEVDSMRTSYALTKRSFKWSIRAKDMLSKGRPSFKRTDSIQDEQQNLQSNQKQINKQKEQASSDDSMDVEEEVGELQIKQPRESNIGLVSQKITEQKGYKFKQRQKEKENPQENHESKLNGWKALESFYTQLSQNQNHSDIISSVEIFGEAMTLFIENQKKFTNIIESDSFVYHSNIGKGSFGSVDLYFFKQYQTDNDSKISNLQSSQQTWNSMNSTIRNSQQQSQQNDIFFSMNQSNNPTPINFTMDSNKSSTSQQKNLLFSSEYQQQQNQNNQMGNQQQNIQHNSIQLQGSQVKQQSIYIEKQQTLPYNSQMSQSTLIKLPEMQYLPVACKKIENLEEYKRELLIMQTLQCEYMPKLIYIDLSKQLLFMELGLCSLEDLKNDSEDDYKFSDEFTYQILVNLIKAVETLLSNINPEDNQKEPIFHSDIKPSNIMLTVKKYKNQQNCSIKLLLIDYGGASFALEDYWSFYTPAFVSAQLWQKLVNNAQHNEFLTWEEVRYAEVYAACRSVQYLIVPDEDKEHFKKENYELFLNTYSHLYPKTCYILKQVYYKESIGQIHDIYKDGILSYSEKTLYTGMNPQNIPFESKKIFELSKFYNCFNEKRDQPIDQIDKEDDSMQQQNF